MECPRRAWPRITCTILMIFEVRVFLCAFSRFPRRFPKCYLVLMLFVRLSNEVLLIRSSQVA